MHEIMLEIAQLPFTIIKDVLEIPLRGQTIHTTILKMPVRILIQSISKKQGATYVSGTLIND